VTSRGFPPVAREFAKVLILGSLPGQVSLEKREYYAHPRNDFWRIMGALFGAGPDLGYAERTRRLAQCGVALWDVCHAAQRPGSMDAAIKSQTVIPNAFAAFFRSHGQVKLICFNGAKAAELYRRTVLADLPDDLRAIPRETLPSTSPANATRTFQQKLLAWTLVRSESRT
jgi:double-stranded uracil-DNA glycosylase